MMNQRGERSPHLAWIDGMLVCSVVMLLLYHVQLRFTGYAYTPQPTGLANNLQQVMVATYRLPDLGWLTQGLGFISWFGFQWIDVLVLVGGFSLVVKLEPQRFLPRRFLGRSLGQVLWPFWTVVWLAYPILWAIAIATKTYFPPAWYLFAGLTFPVVYTYNSDLLLSTSANWWLLSLLLSFVVIFPFLWRLLHRWGRRNLLVVSVLVTVGYRALAVYVLQGHPTYVLWDSPASSQPFALFLAKLSIFVVGMVAGSAYGHRRGPACWPPLGAIALGLGIYSLGFVSQFYYWGWIGSDLLLSAGLALGCMGVMRGLAQVEWLAVGMMTLGHYAYPYFLLYGLVTDRILQFIVQGEPAQYIMALPVMVVGTLILAMVTDYVAPLLRRVVMGLLQDLDYVLSATPKLQQRVWKLHVGDQVFYRGEEGWTVLKVEKLWDEQEFILCQVSDGQRSLWAKEEELKPRGK